MDTIQQRTACQEKTLSSFIIASMVLEVISGENGDVRMLRLKLNEVLENRGRSAYSVAKETGLGEQTLWRLRHNKTLPNPNTIELLCKALDCQPGDLLEYIPDKTSGKHKRPTSKRP